MWQKFKTFIKVVELGGFSKVAAQLGFSKATVTRYIRELEAEYDATLFNRTTRHVYLTEQGHVLYQHVLELLQVQENAQDALQQTLTISGNIKLGIPQSLMHGFIDLLLPGLVEKYPHLSFELIQGDHIYNVLGQQFDLAVHCNPLPDIDLQYATLGTWRRMLVASPEYLEKLGEPKSINELQQRVCLDYAQNNTTAWPLLHHGKVENAPIYSQIKINSSMGLISAASQGLGIAYIPGFALKHHIEQGKLQPIMQDYWLQPFEAYALYPPKRHPSAKIDLMTNALKTFFDETCYDLTKG